MFVLPDDQMNFGINGLTTKSTWDNLILYHERPFDVKESKVMDLKLCYNTFKFKEGETLTQTFTRYKALMNELVNDGIKLLKLEINTGFINELPKKWLAFCQSLRNTNHVKESELASLFGKLKYEENLIDNIYETNKEKTFVSVTPLSTAFFSTSIVQDFQDSPDDEEDTRSSQEYMNDLEEEYQSRALLAKSKRFFKKGTQRLSGTKVTDQTGCHKCGRKGHFARDSKYNKVKAKLAFLSSTALAPTSSLGKNKGLIAEVIEVQALIALADEERVSVCKESVSNGEWVKIYIQKVHTLLEMEDNDDRKSFLDYLCIDLNYVEEQQNNLLSKYRNLVQELNTCKEQLLCISEQIPTQKKKILGIDQLTENTSSSGPKDLVFVKSSTDNSNMSITSGNRPRLSEAEDFILPYHDAGKVIPNESQTNIIDPSVAITNSLASDYDSADKSSVCSTLLPSLEKLVGAEPVSGPKTIKSILKSKSTFKAEALKGVIINEPSSAPAKGNISTSISKTNSAPAGKLKNVKMEDDLPLAIVMKELNELKVQISKNKSSYSKNKNSQQVNQHYTGQGESSLRFRPSRIAIPFPSCIQCGYNDHQSDDYVYYLVYVNETHHKGMIGSLMHLTASIFDIQFSTYLCARYQANPKESHFIDVKRIFKYLKGTSSLGLGAWSTKKQQSVAMSSTKAEYVATAGCCANIQWIRQLSKD
ncbi:hypothetical protein Tco_0248475 [Tanacetum coccineum]